MCYTIVGNTPAKYEAIWIAFSKYLIVCKWNKKKYESGFVSFVLLSSKQLKRSVGEQQCVPCEKVATLRIKN